MSNLMNTNTIAICYSQSGQTLKALKAFLQGQGKTLTDVFIVNLADSDTVQKKYVFPWSVFDFLRAQPEAFSPNMKLGLLSELDMSRYDTVLICYPVWFLSPATPISAFLKKLPENSLRGKRVITLCSCRNMWVEAQLMIASLVTALGGEIAFHATVEDTAPSKKSLFTTLHFFLSGNKAFSTKRNQEKYGVFGIKAEEYDALQEWSSSIQTDKNKKSFFRFRESLVLAEVIGRRISRAIYLPWPLIRLLPVFLQNVYLTFAGVLTVLCIVLLMPPTVVIGNLPPFRQLLNRALNHLIQKATGQTPIHQASSL